MDFQINYVAILAAGVAAMVIGSFWYGKALFGSTWMKLSGVKMEGKPNMNEMAKLYGMMFVGVLVEAYVLAHFIQVGAKAMGTPTDLTGGAMIGFWAWLGFVGPVMMGNYLFGKRPIKLFFIDGGYALVNLLVMGAILGQMG